jgi:ribulose-5-phosphate 4-epimerase/fuculose-1-phosphate aldolase
MAEEGYVKFNCEWQKAAPLADGLIGELNAWRGRLYRLGLIGAYENGVGFGNISTRVPRTGKFIISGTATGNIAFLTGAHYTLVTDFDLEKNWVACRGPVKASSESMTHAAIYEADPSANAVIHVHNLGLWKSLLGNVPTTGKDAEYGTPEMAREVARLFRETDVKEKKVFAMAGHEEGVVSFGKSLGEAGRIMLKFFESRKQ